MTWEQRWHPLREEWVVVAAHRQNRPSLRQRHLIKYLAGPEIGGGNFLSDTSPESSAAELKALPAVHYTAAP
jgi:UDPglucose--hexose-1-phosphate uridylyltransferase